MEMSLEYENSNSSENEEDMEEEYVIERIVGKKILKYKKGKPVYYLIKWKDYGDEYQSWELKSSLSPEIVKEYEMEIRNPKPDCDDTPDYEKKRLENIELKKQFFNAQLQGTISAVKAKLLKKPKPFKCDKCPAEYTSEYGLRKHECKYCKICKKDFPNVALFEKHNVNVHGKEPKVKMKSDRPKRLVKRLFKSLDDKSFKTRSEQEKLYTCALCQSGFITENNLRVHNQKASKGKGCIINRKQTENEKTKLLGFCNNEEHF